MAYKIRKDGLTSGATVYQLRFNDAGLCWDGDSFEAWTGVHADFDGGSGTVSAFGVYLADPYGSTGFGRWQVWLQSGASPSRTVDILLKEVTGYWDGTNLNVDVATGTTIPTAISGISSGSNPTTLISTTIATLASQTSFTLTAGSADNDAYNGAVAVFTDVSTANQKSFVKVLDYVGATKTVTLSAARCFQTFQKSPPLPLCITLRQSFWQCRIGSLSQCLLRTCISSPCCYLPSTLDRCVSHCLHVNQRLLRAV